MLHFRFSGQVEIIPMLRGTHTHTPANRHGTGPREGYPSLAASSTATATHRPPTSSLRACSFTLAKLASGKMMRNNIIHRPVSFVLFSLLFFYIYIVA
jgi:hypothetical protein